MFSGFFLMLLAFATPPEWSRPFPAYNITGNIYYVGTEDLACFLITDPKGHVLINTGLMDSVPQIVAGVEKLGFKMKDVKVLLTNQAHGDHVEGFAEIVKMTGAKVYATPPDAKLLETGGGGQYAPVKVAKLLKDGEVVKVGDTAIKTIYTFGHTQGSSSYEMTVGGKNFLFANMSTVVMPLVNPKYPGIVEDYKVTFAKQKTLHPDIWVAGHGSQYGMKAKYEKKDFTDPAGYVEAVSKYEKLFERQVKIELGK